MWPRWTWLAFGSGGRWSEGSRSRLGPTKDRMDLGALLRVATPADLDEARHGVALIHARGFQRERDLARDLERLIAHGV